MLIARLPGIVQGVVVQMTIRARLDVDSNATVRCLETSVPSC